MTSLLRVSALVAAVALAPIAAASQSPTGPAAPAGRQARLAGVLFADPDALLAGRTAARAGGKGEVALTQLRDAADRALRAGPFSVMHKEQLPPSGDKHDYLSLGRYWWPNRQTPDGLPYIQIDGKVNPEIDTIPDKRQLLETLTRVSTLAHAYFVFGDERYAERAATLLRVWFLDPATRMNPNLEFSQIHKGRKNSVGGSGIIDAREFALIPESVGLLEHSGAWTKADDQGLRDWFRRYLDWLLDSKGGRKEAASTNNHVTFYWYQALPLALYTGQTELADRVLREDLPAALDTQIEPGGSQPRELKRTKPFSYSVFNLMAWTRLAELARSRGVDLWNHVGPGGRGSLAQAFEFLLPVATGQRAMNDDPAEPRRMQDFALVLNRAAVALARPRWAELARQLMGADTEALRYDLLVPTPTR